MKTYQLSPAGFTEYVVKTLKRLSITLIIAVSLGEYIASQVLPDKTLAPEIATGLVAIAIGLCFGLKRKWEGWQTYQLVLDDDVITRKMKDVPDMVIHRDQVVKIQEDVSKGLAVSTRNKFDYIEIPVSLAGYREVRTRFADWQAIEPISKLQKLLPGLAGLFAIAALLIMLVSKNRLIVLPAGLYLCVGLVWNFRETQRNPYIDRRVKRWSWFSLLYSLWFVGYCMSEL